MARRRDERGAAKGKEKTKAYNSVNLNPSNGFKAYKLDI